MNTSNFPSSPTGRYKRSVRNLLIDSRFQLRYTAFLVIVAVVVSVVLGGFLYRTSREVVSESQKVVSLSQNVSDVVKMSIKDNYGDNPLAYFAAFRGLDPASEMHARAPCILEVGRCAKQIDTVQIGRSANSLRVGGSGTPRCCSLPFSKRILGDPVRTTH